jgi:hypothetical protein
VLVDHWVFLYPLIIIQFPYLNLETREAYPIAVDLKKGNDKFEGQGGTISVGKYNWSDTIYMFSYCFYFILNLHVM